MSNQDAKPANWMAELVKKKAAGKNVAENFMKRTSKRPANQSYTWRGGRNGQGKP